MWDPPYTSSVLWVPIMDNRRVFLFPMGGPTNGYDRSYYPEDFSEDMERYRDVEGTECPMVHSSHKFTDYSAMSKEELDYYLYWRSMVRKGKLVLSDYGYSWLYCCELINSKDDPRDVLRRIIEFTELCHGNLRIYNLVDCLAEDYVLAKGLPLSALPERSWMSYTGYYDTWAITRYPMRRTSLPFILSRSVFDWTVARIDDDQLYEVVGMSLCGMDEITRSMEGKGLVTAIGCRPFGDERKLFQGLYDFSCTKPLVMPMIDTTEGPMADLLDGLIRTAVKLMRDDGGRGPSIPRTFPERYRKVVAAAVDAVLYGDPFDPRSFRVQNSGVAGFWEDDDLYVDLSDEDFKPTIFPQYLPDASMPAVTYRTLTSNWALESDVPVDYVPSNTLRSYYDRMDDGQRDYYIYWRTMARRGRILSTDEGYIWLYVVELINNDDDPARVQDYLDDLLDAFYSDKVQIKRLCTAAMDHALLHGFDPNPRAVRWNVDNLILYRKFDVDPIGEMNIHMAEALSGYDSRKYTDSYTVVYEEAFTRALRALDAYVLATEGNRLRSWLGDNMIGQTRRLYNGLWTHNNVVIKPKFVHIGDRRFMATMEAVFKHTIREVRKHRGESSPRVTQDIRDEYIEVITGAVRDYLRELDDEAARRTVVRESKGIRLDPHAIDVAQNDLKAVTEMMATEESYEDIPEEDGIVTLDAPSGPKGGWGALMAALDDVEVAYLRASLTDEGADASVLRGTGRRQQAVEDSINNKAMDAVGDTIVESGHAVEDYITDIEGAMQ